MTEFYSENYRFVNRQNLVEAYKSSYSLPAMNLGARIEERLHRLDMNQTELARRVGVAQPTINALIKGNAQGSKHLHKIASVLQTTPAYLLGQTDDPDVGAQVLPSIEVLADELGLSLIPHLELGYSMGGGAQIFNDYRHLGFVPFQRDWLRPMVKGSFADLFVASGDGDSMMPTILDGDIVLIDTSQKRIDKQDRIWAISYGELGMIKRMRRQPDGSYLILSDNPVVSPTPATDDEFYVVGRVIWIGRRM